MGWEEWIALVLVAVASFGVGGWISGVWERRYSSREAQMQRDHATREARATRRFAIRLEAYKAASRYLSTHELWVTLTEPMWTPAPEPPDLSPDQDWINFGGTVAVTASDAVRDAMRAAADAENAFAFAVGEYRRSRRGDPVDSENPGGDMHKAREAAIAAIYHAQTVMRDELADL